MPSKGPLLYKGKAKSLYTDTGNSEQLIMLFRDEISAFNGEKIDHLVHKGTINNAFNAFIMKNLNQQNIQTHFIDRISENESLVTKLDVFKLECVIRNFAAGGICKRLGIKLHQQFSRPIVEFFYKSDPLGDPLINRYHIMAMQLATAAQVDHMTTITLKVNDALSKIFNDCGLCLVDFKMEFGLNSTGQLTIADEITPDSCRIFDTANNVSLDKDRYRDGLSGVLKGYYEVCNRLNIEIDESVVL